MPRGKPHQYVLAVVGSGTRSAPLRFSEAARVLAAYYQEGLLDVNAYMDGVLLEQGGARSRLVRAASKVLRDHQRYPAS